MKKLQGFYGVDVDGKWGPQSTDAAFGMSADEAWEIYELEAEPEKEKDPWKPEPPKVEKTPAISEPVEDVDYSEGWDDDEPITKPTEVWDDDYDWTKDEEPETKQSPVPPVDPVDTYKPTSYGWEQVEDVDYSEGWDDEPEPKPTIWDDDYDWTKDEEPEPVQTPKPPKTTKATPVVDEPVEGVDYFEGWEDDEPEPVQTPKPAPAVKTEEKPVVNTTPRGNGFGNNRHGSGFSQTTEEATPDPRDRLAEINKELEDLDDTNGFFDVSPYSEEEQRERENRITELKQERDEITALLGKERKEEKAAAEAAKQAQIAEIDREIKDTEDQLAALAKRTDMDAYSKRLESEKLKARRAELVRAKIDVDPSLADRIWAGLGNIFTTSAGGFSAVGDVIKDVLTGKADARGYDANSRSAQYFDYANEAKERALSGTTGAGRALGEAGLAIGQTLSTLPLNVVPGGSLVAMGITSAGQKMDEVKRQGGTSGEAFLRGGVTGMIEGATEAIPLGALFDLAKYGGTSALKSVLKQAGIEATEEAVAYVLNFAADKLARDPNAAFSWSELAKAAAMGGFSGGIMGAGATAVYHANHYDGGRANLLTPEEIAAYNAAEQERIQQEELFAEIERDWYADEEAPNHTEETEDDWDDLFDEEEQYEGESVPVYTDKIKWGIHEIDVRPDGKGFWGQRIRQSNPRVNGYELKINPQNESYHLPHPDGGYVQFENMIDSTVQDGKLVMKQKSFYHVNDMPDFAKNKVLEEAERQIVAANAADYKVEWLVSDKDAVNQLKELFKERNVDIIVTFYPE